MVHFGGEFNSPNPLNGGSVLEVGDMVLVSREDVDFFLIGRVLLLVGHDVGDRHPYQVEFEDDYFWVEDVIKATPLIMALV